jgi:hypothetical protein
LSKESAARQVRQGNPHRTRQGEKDVEMEKDTKNRGNELDDLLQTQDLEFLECSKRTGF